MSRKTKPLSFVGKLMYLLFNGVLVPWLRNACICRISVDTRYFEHYLL